MPARGTTRKTRISATRLNAELQSMQEFAKTAWPKSEHSTGWRNACEHLLAWLNREVAQ